jgi:hypothetical protein
LERIWKEEIVVGYYPGTYLEGLRKATEISFRIAAVRPRFETSDFG